MPPLEEFLPYLERIWQSKTLTNGGTLHQELEKELSAYLGAPYLSLFNNGTIALVTALKALRISGEVITTPFSFVATAHSIVWSDLTPVFVDIDPDTFNIDPDKIEEAITPNTSAIMPVHCYGNPCAVKAIEEVAGKHGLRVIYDAAHTFGVRHDGRSLACNGDLSVLSFHATKVFTTFEGGAIISRDAVMKQRIDRLKNFGIADEVTVEMVGLNGKMSEIHAAFGLLQLQRIDENLRRRQEIDRHYRELLAEVKGIRCSFGGSKQGPNFGYFPVVVETPYRLSRDELYAKLREHGVIARRYFYPVISNMSMYRALPSARPGNLPVANEIAEKILCLPIYPALAERDQLRIVELIRGFATWRY